MDWSASLAERTGEWMHGLVCKSGRGNDGMGAWIGLQNHQGE